MRNARSRPNRRAVKVGYALFGTALVLLFSGIVLTRIEGVITVNDPAVRGVAYWLHVLAPLVAAWLFVLHRLAGKRINWRIGGRVAAAAVVLVGVAWCSSSRIRGPGTSRARRRASSTSSVAGAHRERRLHPRTRAEQRCLLRRVSCGRSRTLELQRPPVQLLQQSGVQLLGATDARQAYERSGDVQASRFCAGCHDPVVFFSGAFDDPNFDIDQPAAHAGITCTSCHAITHINSPRGNADYTIEEPQHYPFAFSDSGMLRYVNHQLVKAKPSCTSGPSSSLCTRPPSSAAPATRSTCRRS